MDLSPRMKHGKRSPRWAVWSWLDIPDRDDPSRVYLRRLRLFATPWCGLYVHRIYLPDGRDHHDHPWPFISLILRGGYREEVSRPHTDSVVRVLYRRERWSVHRMSLDKAHSITDLDPGTVTLVWHGRRQKVWGFWTRQGFVPWYEYEAKEDAEP